MEIDFAGRQDWLEHLMLVYPSKLRMFIEPYHRQNLPRRLPEVGWIDMRKGKEPADKLTVEALRSLRRRIEFDNITMPARRRQLCQCCATAIYLGGK